MPTMKISTKCTPACVFSSCNIASVSAFYPSRPQKNPQNHPHFIHLKIRKSADPHFTTCLLRCMNGVF